MPLMGFTDVFMFKLEHELKDGWLTNAPLLHCRTAPAGPIGARGVDSLVPA